ncbi:MAG: POTRA domain-containing protein [Planctomycetota bacterium]
MHLLRWIAIVTLFAIYAAAASAQFGGGMGGGPGGMGGGAGPVGPPKPKFRDHKHSIEGLGIRREKGDRLVSFVRVRGNDRVDTNTILQTVPIRKGRYYDYDTVLAGVRKLNGLGSFDRVSFDLDEATPGYVGVTYLVKERAVISDFKLISNRGLNDRELEARAGLTAGDPMNVYTIESARRRLEDFYRENGFHQVHIEKQIGTPEDPGLVLFRIIEGPKERIGKITFEGNTIVPDDRLRSIITSRGPMLRIVSYGNNTLDMNKVDRDSEVLARYYHDLGYLTAVVGRRISYSEDGKWMDLHFVIDEGPQYTVNSIQVQGNRFVTEESIRQRAKELTVGAAFNGPKLRKDVGEIVYGYGEQGFIYAKCDPKTILREDDSSVDLIYNISEGDRWKVGEIRINVEGDPYLMKESTILNLVMLREGDWIDLRRLEIDRARLERSQLFETDVQVADPPDIKVVPTDGGKPGR